MDPSDEERHANGLFLPQDIIFVILLHLPAELLWTVARHVCRAWADIISDPGFVSAHYLKSKDALLVQESTGPHFMHHLEKEDRTFRLAFTGSNFVCFGLPSNSCRGLCIFIGGALFDTECRLFIHVANPMTSQVLRLPHLGQSRYKFFRLLYIDQTMKYIAVCLLASGSDGLDFNLFAFSLGTDVSWRKLSYIPEETLMAMSSLAVVSVRAGSLYALQNRTPVAAVGGSLYVLQDRTTIAMINLLEETVSYIQFPHGIIFKAFGLQVRGDYISCMVVQGDNLVVWMLKGAEWLQVCKINNARVISELCGYSSSPVGWLDNCLIFAGRNHLFFWVYDVDNAETRAFTLNHAIFWYHTLIHRNILLTW